MEPNPPLKKPDFHTSRYKARGIVIKNNDILVMRRYKFGVEYYTLVGGGVKEDERPEDAARREIMEESGIDVQVERQVFEEHQQEFGIQYIFLCTYIHGEPVLAPDSEEAWLNDHTAGRNTYQPMWLPVPMVGKVPFRSPALQKALVDGFAHGFPSETLTLASN